MNDSINQWVSQSTSKSFFTQVLRLLYHLVKFGYYQDWEDVQQLLPPMLSLLDGRKDMPFPKDKDKGQSASLFKVGMVMHCSSHLVPEKNRNGTCY